MRALEKQKCDAETRHVTGSDWSLSSEPPAGDGHRQNAKSALKQGQG
jgi:hypothetical protein